MPTLLDSWCRARCTVRGARGFWRSRQTDTTESDTAGYRETTACSPDELTPLWPWLSGFSTAGTFRSRSGTVRIHRQVSVRVAPRPKATDVRLRQDSAAHARHVSRFAATAFNGRRGLVVIAVRLFDVIEYAATPWQVVAKKAP
jgi:hypothetical protein